MSDDEMDMSDNEKTTDLLNNVRLAFISQKSTFACAGAIKLKDPIRIYYESNSPDSEESKTIRTVTLPNNDLKELVDSCQPATFGVGKTEVMDESYRKALKMDADKFASSFQLSETDILHTIKEVLLPHSKHALQAELYKLNVYQEGGFFKSHKDTPRGNGMFGSLVLVLNQPYTGGNFVVRHKKQVLQYGNAAIQEGYIQWFAFYSDCTHKVEKVTSGNRITLTYNLYEGDTVGIADKVSPTDEKLLTTMEELIRHGFKGTIGFPLEHIYVAGSPMKGRDLVTFNTIKLLKRESTTPVVVKKYLVAKAEGCDEDEDDTFMYIPWGGFNDGHELYEREPDASYFKESYKAKSFTVHWISQPSNFGYSDVVAAYGNEPSTTTLYSAGCVLVDIK
ncbi:uncharacterized protein SPPG_00280 [Spizellomyces punctatus DAOM BR117]|uniref:Fe2OG dioxygenase domain-containing protein n=1 Tax=Spizellomyces punctatus (strain DAOM BR117) TaxID=645134 RepID=A0A0L0HT77_SPIPD|nr:uncharacterized protein SPPG_00280 [Spizellomyces punctatus DAOM BR117]KND04556.1 hypothetical protein SPPG_00280 [Spizellomyces punctatus DAOM BR117]|eukprot:XP_016612595.1 hypothetical protein SPPG_00280 [Spizellomyces punctatus DAOM BR117]